MATCLASKIYNKIICTVYGSHNPQTCTGIKIWPPGKRHVLCPPWPEELPLSLSTPRGWRSCLSPNPHGQRSYLSQPQPWWSWLALPPSPRGPGASGAHSPPASRGADSPSAAPGLEELSSPPLAWGRRSSLSSPRSQRCSLAHTPACPLPLHTPLPQSEHESVYQPIPVMQGHRTFTVQVPACPHRCLKTTGKNFLQANFCKAFSGRFPPKLFHPRGRVCTPKGNIISGCQLP